MNMKEIREFKGEYNKSEFYSIMGKFFAEPLYKKDLPYLTNRDNTIWHVLIRDNEVKAFSAYEESKNKICFKADYYLENIKDYEKILKYNLEKIGKDKTIDTATSNSELRALFIKHGFKEYKKTSNYTFLIREGKKDGKR